MGLRESGIDRVGIERVLRGVGSGEDDREDILEDDSVFDWIPDWYSLFGLSWRTILDQVIYQLINNLLENHFYFKYFQLLDYKIRSVLIRIIKAYW